MSNDLTLSDIKTVIDQAMQQEIAKLKRQILEQSADDKLNKTINYKAVCQHMDYMVLEFVTTSDIPEVKAFARKFAKSLADNFGLTERI